MKVAQNADVVIVLVLIRGWDRSWNQAGRQIRIAVGQLSCCRQPEDGDEALVRHTGQSMPTAFGLAKDRPNRDSLGDGEPRAQGVRAGRQGRQAEEVAVRNHDWGDPSQKSGCATEAGDIRRRH